MMNIQKHQRLKILKKFLVKLEKDQSNLTYNYPNSFKLNHQSTNHIDIFEIIISHIFSFFGGVFYSH